MVGNQDPHAGVEKSDLLETSRQRVEDETGVGKNLRVRPELDVCARLGRLAEFLQRLGHLAAFEVHREQLVIAVNFHLQPLGQRVDGRQADAVQSSGAGPVTTLAVELAASVDLGENHFQRRSAIVVHQ